nr:integrase, catalytic region, zinc finger, CCHC-type, peptidase aspartic, catalytic [Tanacetum cinerariifolium]
MSNTNTNLQTQTSNALHNAIMEAGGKDRPPMLAPEGSSETTTKGYMENYKNVSQDIRNQLDVEAENEVNKIRAKRLARTANPLALVAQQQPVYHPQNHPNYYTYNSSTRSQQATTKNKENEIVNSSSPTYDQEPKMVAEDDTLSKEKEINKLMAFISLSFKKIHKPTNNNLKTSLNTSTTNQDNTPRINREPKHAKDVAYHKEKCNCELEAHYIYMAQIQDVSPDAVDNSRPIFDTNPLQKDDDLARERDLLASLIEKLKCEIDDNKNRNKFLESSNKALVNKLKGEIKDFKTKNKSLESSNNHFKEANNELSKTNQLMFKDLKKFQAELDRYRDVNYASKVEIDCAKAKVTTQILPQNMKSILKNTNVIAPGIYKLVKINLFTIDYVCSKHMTGNLKLLSNFVEQFLGTVKFGNDQIALILGYRDLVQGNVTIKRVYYIKALNHNLFSIGQFCDADLEVAI